MTFYNVISAVLFLGAFQQVLIGFAAGSVPHLLMAGVLAVLVFNDSVYTSHVVEGERRVEYRLPLMLIDLVSFCLLASSIVALNPKANVFAVDLAARSAWLTEGSFWLLLGVYWAMIMLWTWRAGGYASGYPRGLLFHSALVAFLFLIEAGLVWSEWTLALDLGRWVAFVYLLAYVALIRPKWLSMDRPGFPGDIIS